MAKWLAVLGLLSSAVAMAETEVGLEAGVGLLDQRFRLHVQPDLLLVQGEQRLHLAAPIEFLSGLKLRRSDWDEPSDYTALLQSLRYRRQGLELDGGKLALSAGAGTVLHHYHVGHHPDRPGSAVQVKLVRARWRTQLALAPQLAAATASFSLWKPARDQALQPELTVVLAGTDESPWHSGMDGRAAVDLTLPFYRSNYTVAGFLSSVMALGSHQDGQWRLHGGLMAEHLVGARWLRWRLEARQSPTGLVATPFDFNLSLLPPTQTLNSLPGPGIGLMASVSLSRAFSLRFAQDPGLQRAEFLAHIQDGKRRRVYLGLGWLGAVEIPFALAEIRWRLQRGATVFARGRLLHRKLGSADESSVVDCLAGISWALTIRRGD